MSDASSKTNLLNFTPAGAREELGRFLARVGQPAYRAKQIVKHLWQNPAPSFMAMTDLPLNLREQLDAEFTFPRREVAARQKSSDGTEKFLFKLHDNEAIETVAIPEGDRVTLCISSQAGCALQC